MQEEDIKLEYDFENIQAVLQDRYLFGKAIVDISTGVSWILICTVKHVYSLQLHYYYHKGKL